MSKSNLSAGLKVRHLTMMGLGSAVGAGLFVGAGQSIATAGPGVLVSYALAGLVVVSVMFMLGEMASAKPSSGAFSTYAEEGVGKWAGFAVGWIYWFMLIMVLGVEILAATSIMATWTPVPQPVIALVLIALFAAVNLIGVRQFGEMEFWFAAIKVAAIIAFLVIGALALIGVLNAPEGAGLSRLFNGEGGFFPTGASGVAAGLLAVMFAFGGIEIITIAAAEATNPQDSISRATFSIIGRILFFYLGSVFIILTVLSWNDPAIADKGAFVAVLEAINVPGAAKVMEVIIVIALLSAFNAQIYGTSRMAYSLSERGEGNRVLLAVSKNGVPYVAVLVSVFFAVLAVILHMVEGEMAGILLDAVGASLLIIWFFIAFSQIRLRPKYEEQGLLRLRTWAHPWLGIGTMMAIAAFGILMLFNETGRRNLLLALVIFIVIVGIYVIKQATSRRDRVDASA
ncbi:amino acid permease [Populibacterium corticicola]|uniref:Amino acid permease n=1 Tax=Populibacterium corticicola TaxID=1812826 RepID=A0ABW5XIZ2_9MICO